MWLTILVFVGSLVAVFAICFFVEKNHEETVKAIISGKRQVSFGAIADLGEVGIAMNPSEQYRITVKFQVAQKRLFRAKRLTFVVHEITANSVAKGDALFLEVVYGQITGLIKHAEFVSSPFFDEPF